MILNSNEKKFRICSTLRLNMLTRTIWNDRKGVLCYFSAKFQCAIYKKVNVIQGNETKFPTTAKHPSTHLKKNSSYQRQNQCLASVRDGFPVASSALHITDNTTKCYTLRRNALPEDAKV